MLDVEEGGLDKRSITSLDSATSITSGMSCFISSDGKERCYVETLPGECDVVNSFGTDGRRHLAFADIFKDAAKAAAKAAAAKAAAAAAAANSALTRIPTESPTSIPTESPISIPISIPAGGFAPPRKPTK